MARMPGAVWRPLPKGFGTRMARYDLVVIHTAVGSLTGTDGYFRSGKTSSNSHFGTGGAGEIWQWGDTAYRSAANGAGNHRSITIENADMGPGFAPWNTSDGNAVPAFTPQQIEANARICAWAHTTHGVPLIAADTSRPNARGVGYHRLGCNPWRVPDGELWSSANGKVCPGQRRIAQIPQIIARARQLIDGSEDIDMATGDEILAVLRGYGRRIEIMQDNLIPGYGRRVENTERMVAQLTGQLSAQDAAIDALTKLVAEQNGLTVDDVRAAVREEVAKGIDVDVTVAPGTSAPTT